MNIASAEKPGTDGVWLTDEVFAGAVVEVTTGVGSGVGQGGGVGRLILWKYPERSSVVVNFGLVSITSL